MNWYTKISQQSLDLTIENDCWDARGGEVFCGLIARLPDGTAAGGLEYSVYDGVYHIKMMRTLPEYQRQGVATQMMNKINELAQNDGATVQNGMSTDEGSRFLEQYTPPFKRQAQSQQIQVWKHHVADHFREDPSLLSDNGAGPGGTVFTDYSKMLEYLKKDGREFYIAPITTTLDKLDFNLGKPYMATAKEYLPSQKGFSPIEDANLDIGNKSK